MEDNRAARRYAHALFDIATNYDVVPSVEDDLNAFSSLIENDPEFRHFFLAPYTSRPEKIAIVNKLFSDRITALSLELIRLMLNKGREREIAAVRDEFIKLRRRKTGVVHADIVSSVPLSETQRTSLVTKLERFTGNKIEADFAVDARIIGGIRVQYSDSVIDGSVRGSLQRLQEQFRHDVLKQA